MPLYFYSMYVKVYQAMISCLHNLHNCGDIIDAKWHFCKLEKCHSEGLGRSGLVKCVILEARAKVNISLPPLVNATALEKGKFKSFLRKLCILA